MFTGGAKIGAFNLLKLPFTSSNLLGEVVDYRSRVIAAGASISDNSLQTIATFVQTLKLNNIWSKFLEISPYAGNDLNAALVKLKYPSGIQSTLTNMNFVSGDYSESTGLTGSTSGTKYLKTGFIPRNQIASALDAHLSIYARNTAALSGSGSAPFVYLGSTNGGNFSIQRTSTTIQGQIGISNTPQVTGTIFPGYLMMGVTANNNGRLDYNGNSAATDTSFSTVTLSMSENYIFGLNFTNTALNNSSNLICAFHSFGYGLNAAESLIAYNAIQTLQSSLGRQV
jgi:hypothetical protein